MLAGAAMLVSTSLRPAMAAEDLSAAGKTAGDEIALAVPRVAPPSGNSGVGLPQPLTPSEAARIRRIFQLQTHGDIPLAIAETNRLTDTTLLGHILADRYLGQERGRVTAPELSEWLGRYADLPDAPAVYGLLLTRLPRKASPPPAPSGAMLASHAGLTSPEDIDPAEGLYNRQPRLDQAVAAAIHAGAFDRARRLVTKARSLSPLYAARLRGDIATALFAAGKDTEALSLGRFATQGSGYAIGQGAFAAGLAAWRQNDWAEARSLFEAASVAPLAPAGLRAAAAFWAARAHLRSGDAAGWRPWMLRAADEPRSFYGLLARRVLGRDLAPALDNGAELARETLGEADMEAVAATPQGRRAFALLQVDQPGRAEAELRRLWPSAEDNPPLRLALLRVAHAVGMDGLAAEINARLQGDDDLTRVAANAKLPPLSPRGGFVLDRALVYALIRLESNFDPAAISAAGAHGLMQLMPQTASYIAGETGPSAGAARRLHDPALNLQLGQRYLVYLGHNGVVNNDLIRLLACYNAGPGNVAHWSVPGGDDPLLYMEAIPAAETRAFVHRALTYMWIYALRLGEPAPSLDTLAAGAWPRFEPEARPVALH
jgi:soluble lytic murein transglycosylase